MPSRFRASLVNFSVNARPEVLSSENEVVRIRYATVGFSHGYRVMMGVYIFSVLPTLVCPCSSSFSCCIGG